MLDSPDIVARFAHRAALPRDYGIGLDERVVEYAWLFAQEISGRMLDAGSTLNHEHLPDRFLGRLGELHVVTLKPEQVAFPERGVSYVYADLRSLPFRSALYDTVACISTLEHVGMDNSSYGGPADRSADPGGEALQAVSELRRVLRPGGRLLMTVPYGVSHDFGWFRQYDEDEVDVLLEALESDGDSVTVYAYGSDGWQLSSLGAAAGAIYREPVDPRPAPDRAVAARAVACIGVRDASRRTTLVAEQEDVDVRHREGLDRLRRRHHDRFVLVERGVEEDRDASQP
jgi:SAM-dependent methyltransferase